MNIFYLNNIDQYHIHSYITYHISFKQQMDNIVL